MGSIAKKAWMLGLVLALGCGSRTSAGDTDGSDTGDDGDDDGGTSTGDGTGDGGTTEDCNAYDDEEGEASDTRITVENLGADPVFLGGLWSCDFARMTVVPTGATDDVHWPLRKCEFSCEEVLGPDGVGCDSSCPIANVIRIEPGGVFGDAWPGDMHHLIVPPEHCCSGDDGSCACFIRRPAPAGEYEATVNVFPEVSCAVGECDCTPNEDGWCEIEGFAETSPEDGQLASVTFGYPVDEAILNLP